jgi:hypothetical protein
LEDDPKEDNIAGKLPYCKIKLMEDNIIEEDLMEDNLNESWSQWKTILRKYDLAE